MTLMRPRPWLLAAFAVVLLLVVGLVVAAGVTRAWFLQAHTEHPQRVDAVLVLAGADDGRHDLGVELVENGVADDLVISAPPAWHEYVYLDYCQGSRQPESARAWCMLPQPMTTAGEAMTFDRLAQEQGWESVVVVTNRPHAHRTGTIFADCSDAESTVVSTEYVNSSLIRQHITREIGGFLKHWVNQPCAEE